MVESPNITECRLHFQTLWQTIPCHELHSACTYVTMSTNVHSLSSLSAECGQSGVRGSLARASGTSCQPKWSSTLLLQHWYITCTPEYQEGPLLIILCVISVALDCRLVLLHG